MNTQAARQGRVMSESLWSKFTRWFSRWWCGFPFGKGHAYFIGVNPKFKYCENCLNEAENTP